MQKLDSYLAIKLESKNKKREQRPYILQNAVNHFKNDKNYQSLVRDYTLRHDNVSYILPLIECMHHKKIFKFPVMFLIFEKRRVKII